MRTYYIYKATNKINGKSYIGKTVDYKTRVWQHRRCYEKENCKFHDAIKKYGFESFEWDILEICNNESDACNLEIHYIELYNSYRDGYNENKGGVGGHNARSIVCLTLDGEYVKRYDSAAEAELKDGFCNSSVLLCCKNKQRACQNHLFMFEDDYLKNGARKYEKPDRTNMKRVVQCDSNGNFINKFESVKEAAEKTGSNRTTISGVLSKKYKTANGYIFVYEEDFPIKDLSIYQKKKKGKRVAQVDTKSGDIINVYDRMADAGKALGVNYKGIQKVVDMPFRTAYGYKWISQ
nr:MAG TPA: intron associated endonuclease [Caudoviricetes sp.]